MDAPLMPAREIPGAGDRCDDCAHPERLHDERIRSFGNGACPTCSLCVAEADAADDTHDPVTRNGMALDDALANTERSVVTPERGHTCDRCEEAITMRCTHGLYRGPDLARPVHLHIGCEPPTVRFRLATPHVSGWTRYLMTYEVDPWRGPHGHNWYAPSVDSARETFTQFMHEEGFSGVVITDVAIAQHVVSLRNTAPLRWACSCGQCDGAGDPEAQYARAYRHLVQSDDGIHAGRDIVMRFARDEEEDE